jgi:pimeloyl-ACP methyl ester carboxylesterase
MPLDNPDQMTPVPITGQQHSGAGELEGVDHLTGSRYTVQYNIDGCTWLYEAELDEADWTMRLTHLLCGAGELANGVLESVTYDKEQDRFALSFSTATSPTQLYTLAGPNRDQLTRHTDERVLGVDPALFSAGEDASFVSYDGLRISARLYLPAAELGYEGKRPLIYYIHGGPQSQERPDFAWFSMPFHPIPDAQRLCRLCAQRARQHRLRLCLHETGRARLGRPGPAGPRARHDEVLPQDERLDTSRAGVVGRSYGGLHDADAGRRHPELWAAAVDMFGPYDLTLFAERVPETWKPFIKMLVGDPETEQDFLLERSPRTYIQQIECPLLVIQGQNDPRVIEQESRELVEELRGLGKEVDYLLFPRRRATTSSNYDNRVRSTTA